MTNPVIIIGMHRSGTSLLTELLEELGLFVGAQKDQHSESLFFQDLNKWIFEQCGARWDTPSAVDYLWENQNLLQAVEDYVRNLVESPRVVRYLGQRLFWTNRAVTRLTLPWGWKDPRNTFTLPLWLRIFPEAKVLHIKRHGVDVAQSLVVRSRNGQAETLEKYQKYRRFVFFRPKRGGFMESPRCAKVSGGFSLWNEYLEKAGALVENLAKNQVLELKYEDLVTDIGTHLTAAANFCELDAAPDQIRALASNVRASRVYSFLRDPALIRFAERHESELNIYNYDQMLSANWKEK